VLASGEYLQCWSNLLCESSLLWRIKRMARTYGAWCHADCIQSNIAYAFAPCDWLNATWLVVSGTVGRVAPW
jgi:hypothetical protein